MSKKLLALTLLSCTPLFLIFFPRTSFSFQNDKKVVKKISQHGEPVEIAKLKIKGKPLSFDQEFDADEDWMKGLTVDVKNVSDKDIIYIKAELDFPVDDAGAHVIVVPLEYGHTPGNDETSFTTNPLHPGASVNISVADWSVDFLKRKIVEKGSGKALKMNRANIYVLQVWFDADTVWSNGTIFTRDQIDKKK